MEVGNMNILIVNCHWDNHGDESAIRAMIDELQMKYPEANIFVQRALGEFKHFPENDKVKVIPAFPDRPTLIPDTIACLTKGKLCLTSQSKVFYETLYNADIVLHAPGGPSIGDIYLRQERAKLWRLMIIRKSGVPYAFYAPSMGPFKIRTRNYWRKKVLESASFVCLREELSAKMVSEFAPAVNPIVTLDSAFQHDVDSRVNQEILNEDKELKEFVGDGENVIGFTITDLQWNSLYREDGYTKEKIHETVTAFVDYLVKEGYKVLFIPQLFENADDSEYMKRYAIDNCYVMNANYDCYFQQYVISRVKAVVGMRYHSNIFSAKMGTPFVSISYEQKMKGFMGKAGLIEYCLDINELSFDALQVKFNNMMMNYSKYKSELMDKKEQFKKEAGRTTELVCELIVDIKYKKQW